MTVRRENPGESPISSGEGRVLPHSPGSPPRARNGAAEPWLRHVELGMGGGVGAKGGEERSHVIRDRRRGRGLGHMGGVAASAYRRRGRDPAR